MATIYKMTDDVLVDIKGQSWMDVGIHDNVELVDIVSETSPNGNHFLAFYFENERGEKASKTEWEVKANKPVEQMDEKEKDAYIAKVQNQMARIGLIARQFIDKRDLIFESPSFKHLGETIKQKLSGRYKGVKLRIKIIYDYNDWATLPTYVKYPWIERTDSIPAEKSRIKIIENVDKLVKSTEKADNVNSADVLPIEANPLASTAKTDEIPF